MQSPYNFELGPSNCLSLCYDLIVMPKIKLLPIVQSITIALIFFVVGRLMVIQMGDLAIWIVAGLLIVFYVVWWILYRRSKRKE